MDYFGEHLLPGKLGHFFILLSFISSIVAAVAYFLSVQHGRKEIEIAYPGSSPSMQWKKLGRLFFFVQVISVFAVFMILFHIISNHYFEYKYAWQHSSLSLETKYLLSCFWEGQEGSFLLWSVWHCVLGVLFIFRERKWEAPVMFVVSIVQVILATMLLGDLFGMHIGSNPFTLMRNSTLLDNAPAFYNLDGNLRPDYLGMIKDGNDLNPLLQNYWMVIHPPVLFLGFASTLIPFAFAIAGLWTKKYGEWIRPALPWALFSAGMFGLGIMMGSKWAYESLNFGGYWAWDPVENASLVPWLVLVAGIHAMMIYRHTGNALRTSHLFLLLSFLLVIYSTYLTRSGVLQDTSVHAFTGEGITPTHLLIFLFGLAVPSLGLLISRYKKIPFIAKEEETSAREFWMFVGSLVLFLSALLIILMTSVPVINKIAEFTGLSTLFSKDELFHPLAVGEEAEYAYNRIQIFVAIILGIFTGFGMYLKYKSTGRAFLKKLVWPVLATLVVSALILAFGNINYDKQGIGYQVTIWIGVVASVFAMIANGAYIFSGFRGKLKNAGGSIAHLGFGMMMLGILISASKREVLSYNTSGIPVFFGKDSKENPGENLTLVKGIRTDMGKYWVTYEKDSTHPRKPYLWFYHLKFESKDGEEKFMLFPNAFVNYKENMGLMANPDAQHYLNHDIFTYITSLPDPNKKKDTSSFQAVKARVGDTVFYSGGFAILQELKTSRNIPGLELGANDSATVARLKVTSKTSSIYTVNTLLLNKDGGSFPFPDTVMSENLVIQLQKAGNDGVELGIKESNSLLQYVTLKAYKFPWINLLWVGTILTVIGFIMSMFKRMEKRKAAHAEIRVERKKTETV